MNDEVNETSKISTIAQMVNILSCRQMLPLYMTVVVYFLLGQTTFN